MEPNKVKIQRLVWQFYFSYSDADLVEQFSYGTPNQNFGSEAIAKKLRSSDKFEKVTYEVPDMFKQPRDERRLFSASEWERLAILRCEYSGNFTEKYDALECREKHILINPRGAIGVLYEISLAENHELSSSELIEKLSALRYQMARLAGNKILNIKTIVLHKKTEKKLPEIVQHLSLFEGVDFDCKVGAFEKFSIKNMLQKPHLESVKEFCGFLRSTRSGVWKNYPTKFVQEFLRRDVSNRDDEIWIINGSRIFRRHPEAVSRADVNYYFNDVCLASWTLLSFVDIYRVAAESTVDLSFDISVSERNLHSVSQTQSDLIRKSVDVARLMERVSYFDQRSKHGFFRKLMLEIRKDLNFDKVKSDMFGAIQLLFDSQNALNNHIYAQQSTLQNTQMETLSKRVYWLTLLVTSLAVLQFVKDFNLMKTFKEIQNNLQNRTNIEQPVLKPDIEQPVLKPDIEQPVQTPKIDQPVLKPETEQSEEKTIDNIDDQSRG